jgi:HNH endonuclease
MTPDYPGYRDPRRSFTRAEVYRVWELQGRVCKLCRRAIPVDLMHGDHISPWIEGGRTELTNLQALCGSCNLRKGSRPQQVIAQFFDVVKCAPATAPLPDEVHHAGIGSGWGQASQTAFGRYVTAILSLSGTPFRTDLDPIVFIPSENGAAKPHYRYSYRDAIIDGACRPVQFVEVRGQTTFRTEDGEVHEVSFQDEDLSDLGARRRMRAALEWIEPGSIADKMLQDANAYLIGLRAAGDGDAAGLVVCVDCDHADRVAAHMAEHVLRTRPVVACSRSYDPNDPDRRMQLNSSIEGMIRGSSRST